MHAHRRLATIIAIVCLVIAGCTGSPSASQPGPSQACNGSDPSAPGYYPTLEARLPKTWQGKVPTSVNSGRYCSARTLGTLQSKGIGELRYGGETWLASDGQSTLSMVTYQAAGLTAAMLADEFEAGARAAHGTQGLDRVAVTVGGRPGTRLDVLTSSTREVRIVWPAADGAAVNAIIASEVTEDALTSAMAAFSS